jgi:hypothetical protein
MRSTELRHPAAYPPLDVVIALHRYGIDVAESAVACIDIQPVPQDAAESVPTDGCEVIELPCEVAVSEYPVIGGLRESVPVRRASPALLNKEIAHGHLASA